MFRRTKTVANLQVGKADTTPSSPTHVAGVREGNKLGAIHRQAGLHQDPNDARFATASAARSTGINPRARDPIDPRMPHLPPP
jgi:hypothetical protein